MQRPGIYKMLHVHTHYMNPQYCVWVQGGNFAPITDCLVFSGNAEEKGPSEGEQIF